MRKTRHKKGKGINYFIFPSQKRRSNTEFHHFLQSLCALQSVVLNSLDEEFPLDLTPLNPSSSPPKNLLHGPLLKEQLTTQLGRVGV